MKKKLTELLYTFNSFSVTSDPYKHKSHYIILQYQVLLAFVIRAAYTDARKSSIHTLPSSVRQVSMTIRLLFTCQTILQKSTTVCSVKGPVQRRNPVKYNKNHIFSWKEYSILFRYIRHNMQKASSYLELQCMHLLCKHPKKKVY